MTEPRHKQTVLEAAMPQFAPCSLAVVRRLLDIGYDAAPVGGSMDEMLSALQELLERRMADLQRTIATTRPWVMRLMGDDLLANGVKTGQFIDLLREASPGEARPNHALIGQWRDRGLLRMKGHGIVDSHSAAAILIARRIAGSMARDWLPQTDPAQAAWYAWLWVSPDSMPVPTLVPVVEQLPPTALLWTPWQGAGYGREWELGMQGSIRLSPAITAQPTVAPSVVQDTIACWVEVLDQAQRTLLEAHQHALADQATAPLTQQFQRSFATLLAPSLEGRLLPLTEVQSSRFKVQS